jgi:2-oxo-4-hydroxy-4-carboxy-5-ureidoimidazoline decarboxylase
MPSPISEINTLSEAAFVMLLGGVFEHSPWVAQRTWPFRPFQSLAQLHSAMCRTMWRATAEEQISLIRSHPDLGDRLSTLTPTSAGEQAAAGLHELSDEERLQVSTLNAAYKAKFGFPFILCARLHDKHTMLAAFGGRLPQPRSSEIETALREIEKIAELRLNSIVAGP